MWGFQSRGTILCYSFTVIFILIFFQNKKKILSFFGFLVLPVLLFYSITYLMQLSYKSYNFNEDASLRTIEEIMQHLEGRSALEKFMDKKDNIIIQNRFVEHGLHTSGRFEIWKYSIENYDSIKIFGYGSQGDRFILKKI